ncbi:MAG: KpsF/GutQ family sugar-phosphate isomerase, partial [Endomicrobiia bacterium]|nr:KpsF/GutQ family sugar-phosphate isomerase [Endomicrobiia bacterium]
SYSGDSDELKKILQPIRGIGSKIIGMTGRHSSYLAKFSDCVLRVSVAKEACPYNMVPTASTTAMLAMGDALALAVAMDRGFKKDDFAKFHPGGNLGKRLNLKVADIMRRGRANPVIRRTASVRDALRAMTSSKLGAVSIADGRGRLIGYFTDGDLRRRLQKKGGEVVLSARISDVMTSSPKTVLPSRSAYDAASMMKKHNCDNLPVVDSSGRPVGIIDERDLVASGLL